jgi:hypothetical protein
LQTPQMNFPQPLQGGSTRETIWPFFAGGTRICFWQCEQVARSDSSSTPVGPVTTT